MMAPAIREPAAVRVVVLSLAALLLAPAGSASAAAVAADGAGEVVATAQGRPDAPPVVRGAASAIVSTPDDGPEDLDAPRASPSGCRPQSMMGGPSAHTVDDRRMHGSVSVAAGTQGYRSAYGEVSMPVGQCGVVTVGYGQMKTKAPVYYSPYGVSPYGVARPFP